MAGKIHYLYERPTPLAHFVRVGYGGHRQLEALVDSGRFAAERIVIDAARYDAQRDLVDTLWTAGTEIVLDPNVAELSSVGRYQGACRDLAWANKERPLLHDDFRAGEAMISVDKIADFVAERKIDTVLAPAHLVEGARDEWVPIDARLCELLRKALDERDRGDVAIDYQLIIPYSVLRDSAHRRAFVEVLRDLPFDNLWIRTAGFGADATGVGVRRYISGISDLHPMGRPLIADCAGGLAGIATLAFGAATGIAHGVAEKERFDSRSWKVPPKKGGGGQNGRLYLPGLDRHFKLSEARALMNTAGGRRLLACPDHDCCPRGLNDMENDPKAHFLTQRRKQIADIERMPDLRRATHFLDHHLASVDRTARQAAKLRIRDERIAKMLTRTTQRLDRMRTVLEDLDRTLGHEATRSARLTTRALVRARREAQGR